MSIRQIYNVMRARLSPAAWKAALKNAALGNEAGTTLIESVCGILILTTIVVSMYAGILTAQKVLGEGDTREQQGQAAFAALERGEGETGAEQQFRLDLGGVKVSFSGQYAQAGGTDSFADGVRDMFIYWETRLKGMTKAEQVAEGYTKGYISNTALRDWIREEKYGKEWPIFPKEFFERYLTEEEKVKESGVNGLLTTPYYVQPYHSPSTTDPNINTFVFAAEKPREYWVCRLIYDHEEKAWYYRPSGSKSFTVNQDWAYIKAYIHGPEWRKLV